MKLASLSARTFATIGYEMTFIILYALWSAQFLYDIFDIISNSINSHMHTISNHAFEPIMGSSQRLVIFQMTENIMLPIKGWLRKSLSGYFWRRILKISGCLLVLLLRKQRFWAQTYWWQDWGKLTTLINSERLPTNRIISVTLLVNPVTLPNRFT